ncbi:Uncharacterised protein [Mycolicibacterium fortuitum]|uniref:Uncharacterized protein n=1 Tax=Mycolicibacterium fortuitum TaxID=1766 RepID=A0A378WD48_MYCFO|nr:Uncharacterised protein [Mycolicibacterium fortuitum]
MGFRDFFGSGSRKPEPDVVAVSPQELWQRLMRLNNAAAPWRVRQGTPEGVDLVAEWRTGDSRWQPVFDEININESFTIHMRFDPEKSELRAKDHMWEWRRDDNDRFGKIRVDSSGNFQLTASGVVNGYQYTFDTNDIKNPVRDTVTASGWTYRGLLYRSM